MLQKQNTYKIALMVLGCLAFTISTSYAQYGGYGVYGGGYGGGYGARGYGRGYGNQFQHMDNGKPKPPPDPDEVAEQETKLMVKKLKLTEDQEIVIASLNEDYAYQRKDLYDAIKREFAFTTEQAKPDQIAKAKERVAALDAKKDKELEKILTPEQMKTYQEMKEKNKKH